MELHGTATNHGENSQKRVMVQRLLSEIYSRYHLEKQLDSSTETSCLSDGIHGLAIDSGSVLKREQNKNLQVSFLKAREMEELQGIKQEIDKRISVMSSKLVRQLKQRNRLRDKNKRYCDTITAVLQAVSKKRKIDAKLQFNMEPPEGEEGFKQWCDALRAIVRLPGGLPSCWRKRIWVCLADQYMESKYKKISQTINRVFSDRICPADESLGNQIVKDLHRTGYTNVSLSDESSIEDRLILKRVLLAYARWNQAVGYCQGFNVLAALILQVTDGNETAAFKIMAYLVDGVLPENYFANNLQALSVDMAVFRDFLRARLPQLSKHLDVLQKEANEAAKGSNYEPPLTNVFTMQWFLTLFATCLPLDTVLRIWDSVLLDGNEILLRVALAIWAKLGEKIGETQSADEFYCNMSELMQKALNGKLVNTDDLVRLSYRMASFPFPNLKQLREKYTYNITPFAAENAEDLKEGELSPSNNGNIGTNSQVVSHYDEDAPFFCFTGFVSTVPSSSVANDKKKPNKQSLEHASSRDRFGESYPVQRGNSMMAERMSTDIAALKNQYLSIRSRQLRAHLVYTKPVPAKNSNNHCRRSISPKVHVPVMVNHLLIGRNEVSVKNLTMSPMTIKDRQISTKKMKSSSSKHTKPASNIKSSEDDIPKKQTPPFS